MLRNWRSLVRVQLSKLMHLDTRKMGRVYLVLALSSLVGCPGLRWSPIDGAVLLHTALAATKAPYAHNKSSAIYI